MRGERILELAYRWARAVRAVQADVAVAFAYEPDDPPAELHAIHMRHYEEASLLEQELLDLLTDPVLV